MRLNAVYSGHDGGWYVEVFDVATGRELYVTPICATKAKAIDDAKVWVCNNG
jgi:hypothetical protein